MSEPKVLIADIETAPNLAYVWRFFKENISPKQILEDCTIIAVSAKWLGESEVYYWGGDKHSEAELLSGINGLLDEADLVVGHNSSRFDTPKIRGRSLVHGLDLPSPYKQMDTCKVARREFGFDANSLEYLSRVFGVEQKGTHKNFPGFELWSECIKGNPKAWAEMKEYNIQDIITTEQVYLKIRSYDTTHWNVGVLNEDGAMRCPKCGSTDLHRRGFQYTNVGKYQRYQCLDCAGWARGRFTERDKSVNRALLVNAV